MKTERERAARRREAAGSARLRRLIRDYERMSAAGRADNRPIGGVNCCCCRHIHGRPNAEAHASARSVAEGR
jgi:hypothetical protein